MKDICKVKHEADKNGSLDACKACSGIKCCGNIRRGGTIEPPFLCRHDIRQIESFTGLNQSLFTDAWLNAATGNTVFFMKISDEHTCFFLDPEEGKCRIYAVRPVDCRLFPLDIEKTEEGYHWIQYNYKYCHLTGRDKRWLSKYKDIAIRIFGEEIQDYATISVPGMERMGYEVLCPVVGI